ncbi:MAG: hypothetical protein ACK4HE_04345 [Chitinophagaceae bacterium]
MKKIYLAVLALLQFTTISLIVISCGKTANEKKENPTELAVSYKEKAKNAGRGECSCDEHGGAVGVGIQWNLATCKSDCKRGIGFRCGKSTYLSCHDGYSCSGPTAGTGSCPATQLEVAPERLMTAIYTFYNNGSLMLTFLKPIPQEEINLNGNTIFEVESDEMVNLSQSLLINGTSYKGYKPTIGNYVIDFSNSQYGTVTFPIQLIE